MALSGPVFCGTGANSNDGGTTAWTNPTNVEGDTTGTAATCNISSNGGTSQLLRATNFDPITPGFAIPATATIDGVVAEIELAAANNNRHYQHTIRLLVGGTETGDNKSTAATISNSKQFVSWGGATDVWGATLTPADVNASDFGVSLKISRSSTSATTTSASRVRMTVYYTDVAPDTGIAVYYVGL